MNSSPAGSASQTGRAPGPPATDSYGWRGALLVAALAALAYTPAIRSGWVWDDNEHITQNRFVREWDGLDNIWFAADTPQYYPLVFTTFWLEHKLWGLDPTGYHVVNLALHLANALLVWRLARALRVPAAGFLAAVFALHPVHVESVAWVTERKNVLSGLFYLLAFSAYLRFDDTARWRWYAAAATLFVAAMLSKTVTVTLPVTLVLALVWRRKLKVREGNGAGGGGRVACPRRWRWGRPDPGPVISGVGMAPGVTSGPRGLVAWLPRSLVLRHALALVPMILAGAALGLTTAYLERYSVGAEGAEWSLPFFQRLLILAPSAFCFYAAKIAWPHPLIFIYPRWEIAAGDWHWWLPALALLTAFGLLIAAIRRCGWGPLLLLLFSGVTLFPALGLFNVYWFRFSYVADHFQYLGSLGFIALYTIAGVALSRRLWSRSRRATVGNIVATLILLALAGLTQRQSRAYYNAPVLWRNTLNANPNAWIAMINLSGFEMQAGRPFEALQLLERAARYPHAEPEVVGNRASLALAQGRNEEAAQLYRRFATLRPMDVRAHSGLRETLSKLGRLDEAAAHLEQALKNVPGTGGRANWVRSQMWFELAQVRIEQDRLPEAAQCLDQALTLYADQPDVRAARARVQTKLDARDHVKNP